MRCGQRTLVARTACLFLDIGQTSDRHEEPARAPYPEAVSDLKKGSLRIASALLITVRNLSAKHCRLQFLWTARTPLG